MAKKGKVKISKVKRNNQTTNKMRKAGQLKLQRHKPRVQKQREQHKPQQPEYSSESEPSGDEWADMLDDEEQKYILSRIAKQPQLLSNVPENDPAVNKRGTKRKKKEHMPKPVSRSSDSGAETDSDSNSDMEEQYEKEMAERPVKKMRPLLPIKTKEGVFEQAEECDEPESDTEEETKPKQTSKQEKAEATSDSEADSGMEGTTEDSEVPHGNVVTTVDLMAARRDKLNHDKLRIGALCSSLLECPEKKLKNLYPVLYLMEERLKDGARNLLSVRKLATLSAAEVFRDVLPDYCIRHQDYSNVKLKKDTLALYKYEKELLEFYKRYLQRLEKAFSVLRRKKGDNRRLDESTESLALVSVKSMCSLLAARPDFNYSANVAQSLVPLLDCRLPAARAVVAATCADVFANDNRGEITLTIVRLINQLVKRRGERLHPSALDCLLSLRIRDVALDEHADLRHKKRQEEKHKKRIVNLSKKEKKRAKKLKEVERELLETEAKENEAARKKLLTEVTKTVFHIYFRLLKTAQPGLLPAALSGLAKFTHVINLEYYSDLVAILSRVVADEATAPRTRLLCVRAVLAILAGAGDALNIDPAHFHAHLYTNALGVHAGASHEDAKIVLEAATQICARARRVSPAVLQALAKRLATLAAQLLHNGALAALALVYQLAQNKAVSALLETDEPAGSGRFDAFLPSPEHCNAHAARLHELCALRRHYHPAARAAAAALLARGPWLQELTKLSPVQIFEQYDGSQMAFKPAVPPPGRSAPPASHKLRPKHAWTQIDFKRQCETLEDSVQMVLSEPVVR